MHHLMTRERDPERWPARRSVTEKSNVMPTQRSDASMKSPDNRISVIRERRDSRRNQAKAIIVLNTGLNAGTAIMPLGTSVIAFIAANAFMIRTIGKIYGFELTNFQSAGLIRQILISIGTTWSFGVFTMKLGVEVAKVTGLATFGATTAVACTVDAALSGSLSYALGHTALVYFEKNCQMDRKEMRAIALEKYEERLQQFKSKSPGRPADESEHRRGDRLSTRRSTAGRVRARAAARESHDPKPVDAPTEAPSGEERDVMDHLFASFKPDSSD
jgi:uncharacterized protein (DUF697 family)